MMDIKRGGKQVKDSMFNYGKDTCVSNSVAHTGVLSIRHKDIPLTYKMPVWGCYKHHSHTYKPPPIFSFYPIFLFFYNPSHLSDSF